MKPVAHIGLHLAARTYTPLLALFGAVLAATSPAGSGIGLTAGAVFAALHVLHVIVYGAGASRIAAPPMLLRCLVVLGLLACLAAIGAPGWRLAQQMGEVGLFLISGAGFALVVNVLVARAPSLREEDW